MKKGFVISWYYPPGNSSEGLVTFKLLKNSKYSYDVWTRADQQQNVWDRKSNEDKLVADNVEILCDDHAVIDAKTKQYLNIPSAPVLVGNHVWLGRKYLLLKGAQIPDDCIIATRSVVTKKLEESNCIIAGQPAKIVKNYVSWNSLSPVDYEKSLNS